MTRQKQRKQVTVLFADVVGFTAMSETMDAEDVYDTMNVLWARLDRVILKYDGTIDKHIGDNVMALWGAEVAREDDPERAIRAALAMQAQIRDFNAEAQPVVPLHIRIGLNTGPVLLGKVGALGEYTAIGNTVNLASRLESAAPVGGILVSHDTYRHVRGVFDVQAQEPIEVKGRTEPLQVYVVQRAKPRAFRRGTRGVEGVETRMIGREAELKRMQDALYTAMADGERQMMTVSGEAGVGKSRLLYEFENWVDLLPEEVRYFKGRASQEMQNVPYALMRDLFSFRFQIQDSDQAGVVWEKMEGGIGESLGEDEGSQMKAHFIGQLLGFDFNDSPHLQGALDDAKQVHDRALIYLSEFFRATTEQLPTVTLLEDVHWADDSSLDMIGHLARATSDCRLLIVCLARPVLFERRPCWGEGQAFHTDLELKPLSKRDGRRLVEEILQKVAQVPEALRELVVGRAEGNPFYVEELIKMLIEDSVIVKGEERWQVEPARLTGMRVPPTLTGVLQARLDSLSSERRTVLQLASVVGRMFWDSAVERISASANGAMGEDEIQGALSTLRGKEMIFRRKTSAFAGTQEFVFKHAILREVTYESVLKRRRPAYHACVAEWLLERSGGRAGEYAGLIANHLDWAGRTAQALPYLRQAGERAAAQFANAEAIAYFGHALDLTPETDTSGRYALFLAREKLYHLRGERGAQRQDLATLQELTEALDDDRQRVEVALRRSRYAQATGDYPAAIAAARQAIKLAQTNKDVRSEALGYVRWGAALCSQGKHKVARRKLKGALSLSQTAQLRQVEATSLHDFGIVSAMEGDLTAAQIFFEQSLYIFREVGDRRGEGSALNSLGAAFAEQGDYTEARIYFEQSLYISGEMGDRRGETTTLGNLGAVSYLLGDFAGAETYYERNLSTCREIGSRGSEATTLGNLGNLLADQGDYTRASDCYEQALLIKREIGDRGGEGVTLNNLGFVSSYQGDYVGAEAYFERTLDISREIGDRRSEGNVLGSLGLLSHFRGDDKVARDYSQQAVLIAEGLGDRPTQSSVLTFLGHALTGLGYLGEAAETYQKAVALRQELGQPHLAMESLAGLARVSLAQGDLAQALTRVEKILSHLEGGTLEGAEEPFRVYLTCYRVLHANQDPRARDILNTAHSLLQERADKINDDEMRHSFLENVAAHREIVSAFVRSKRGNALSGQ